MHPKTCLKPSSGIGTQKKGRDATSPGEIQQTSEGGIDSTIAGAKKKKKEKSTAPRCPENVHEGSGRGEKSAFRQNVRQNTTNGAGSINPGEIKGKKKKDRISTFAA